MNTIYPLGHTAGELTRLDAQAMLMRDSQLDHLAFESTSCLEIGCGNGSNLPLLRMANPKLKYTGIDTSAGAIAAARARFDEDVNAEFLVMDGSSTKLDGEQFDLIFTKLVLWSVGPSWSEVLQEALRLLVPGGTFYAFEPCNHLVQLFPNRPAAQAWMDAWDKAAIQRGLDPFIGPKVADGLRTAGFTSVDSKFFPVIAPGTESDRYKAIVENLKGFYMGPSAHSFGLTSDSQFQDAATAELDDMSLDNLVMDALYVSWGTKAAPSCA